MDLGGRKGKLRSDKQNFFENLGNFDNFLGPARWNLAVKGRRDCQFSIN